MHARVGKGSTKSVDRMMWVVHWRVACSCSLIAMFSCLLSMGQEWGKAQERFKHGATEYEQPMIATKMGTHYIEAQVMTKKGFWQWEAQERFEHRATEHEQPMIATKMGTTHIILAAPLKGYQDWLIGAEETIVGKKMPVTHSRDSRQRTSARGNSEKQGYSSKCSDKIASCSDRHRCYLSRGTKRGLENCWCCRGRSWAAGIQAEECEQR